MNARARACARAFCCTQVAASLFNGCPKHLLREEATALVDVPADFGVDSLYFEFYGINPLKDWLARVFAVFLNSVSKLAGVDYSSPLIVRDENMSADLALNDYDDSGIRHSRMLCLECLVTIIATVVAAIATLNIVYKRFS